jgi:hypothetical protein
MPRDFDISPYFEIVKPTIVHGFDYTALHWADKQKPLEEVAGEFGVFQEDAPPLVPEEIDEEAPVSATVEEVTVVAIEQTTVECVRVTEHFLAVEYVPVRAPDRRSQPRPAKARPDRLGGFSRCSSHNRCLPVRSADDFNQFRDLLALIGLVAARDRMLDAMGDVVLQDLLFDPPQRGAHRRDLRDDVDAVAVLVDHFREAADLALDPAQAFLQDALMSFRMPPIYPPQGIGFKAGDRDGVGRQRQVVAAGMATHAGHGHQPSSRGSQARRARSRLRP